MRLNHHRRSEHQETPDESKPSLAEKASRSRYRSLRQALHRSVHDLTPRSFAARLGSVCRSCRSDVLEAGWSYSGFAIARLIDCLIHQALYVLNLPPFAGSKRSTAFIRPMFPSEIKSRSGSPKIRVVASDLNDQSEVCFDHPSPSLLVSLLNACGQLNLLLRSQQRSLADLSKVNLNARLRIVSHAPTSPQIGSEATAGFDS